MSQVYRRQHRIDVIFGDAHQPLRIGRVFWPQKLSYSYNVAPNIPRCRSCRGGIRRRVGSGIPRHEFKLVDDLADALVFLMRSYGDEGIVNVGTGTDVTISELADLLGRIVGLSGEPCKWQLSQTAARGV